MKNFTGILSLLLVIVTAIAQQQNNAVPKQVKAAFTEKFANASKVKWEKENANEWEAEFIFNGKQYSAIFNQSGKWKKTEYHIEIADLPALVKKAIADEFEGFQISKVELMETVDGKFYEVKFVDDDGEEQEILFDKNGTIVDNDDSSAEEDENDKSDDEDDIN